VIPQRDDQRANHQGRPLRFGKKAYRRRRIIEHCIGWLKECRRAAPRLEKLAINFLAKVKVPMIQRVFPIRVFRDSLDECTLAMHREGRKRQRDC
jgi:hypothetical protein